MVTTINDRTIIHLTSGGEYNVAMDTDSQIWVWGRNEFCQVRFYPELHFF
jgi:alpha-tubulin suppressor-like RCC1 family protein